MAAVEATPNSTHSLHCTNTTSLVGTRMWEKNMRCPTYVLIPDGQSSTNSGPLFDSMEES